ncbi:hypothetical protein QFC19_004121 [Naganishia cerealis]|uniref:Uncharacterized protein n=1 Tax=Naganishia cerealis TaxID=610337 RepID=A0ACC2VXR8_9TREE|nr:hypothetical protein QFC19_004121 [Naganishia cerealis]
MSDVENLRDVEWLFFDVFGTVVDWKSHISQSMLRIAGRVEPKLAEKHPDSQDAVWQDRVQQWRNEFMSQAKTKQGKREKGGMDEGHRLLLDKLLEEWKVSQAWDDKARDELVKEWHKLQGWSDSAEGLKRLHERFIFQEAHSSPAHSGDSIGTYKPDPAMYQQAIRLSRLPPSKVAMVAAHGYDLDAAKSQ